MAGTLKADGAGPVSGRDLAFVFLAALALLLLVALGLSHWLGGRAKAVAERERSLRREAQRHAAVSMDRFFRALPAAVYRGELFPDGSLLIDFMSEGLTRLAGGEARTACEPGAWRARLDPHAQAKLDVFHRRLLDDGEAVVEYSLERPDGTQVWLRDSARVTGLGPQGLAEVAGLLTDVTAERMLADRAVLASKLATLGRMATSIVHELTQPLGAITIASETALAELPERADDPMEKTRRRLGRIGEHAERARQLIDHLRNFGRADAGPEEPVDLTRALDGAMILAEPMLLLGGVEIVTRLPEGLPPVRGRIVLLEQVLVNLAVNARDAMARQPDGTRRLVIAARHIAEANEVELVVEDSGPGFADDMARRAFDAFVTTKQAGQGTGLGLAICHGIITGFGGDITARNTEMGAAITLRLPVWAAPPERAP